MPSGNNAKCVVVVVLVVIVVVVWIELKQLVVQVCNGSERTDMNRDKQPAVVVRDINVVVGGRTSSTNVQSHRCGSSSNH